MSRAKSCLMSMPIFHPWLARRNSEIPRTEGGRRGREEWSPSWGLGEAAERREGRGIWEREMFRTLLWAKKLRTRNSRGVLCRAWLCDEARTAAKRQSGRERPRLPPPGPGPGPSTMGVAHAPAACLVCPDEVVRARAIDGTRCEYRNRHSDGHAQHVETVAAIVHIFLNRRMPCL